MKTNTTATKFELVAPIIRPRVEQGIDYSRPCPVLVRKGHKELFKAPGGNGWICVGRSGYHKTRYELRHAGDFMGRTIHEGGRLTKAALEKLKPKLEEFFGEQDFVHLISTRHTIVFKEDK